MITVVNKSNKGLYNELFEEVQNWLYTHNSGGEEVEPFANDALLRYVQVYDATANEGQGGWVDTDEPETITSLEELFTNMEFITRFANLYTRLPLDEEPFFIDANKRTIDVPKDFATNGVSVQGDEIAEVLFFKINRFFDATDLAMQDIFIQWKSSEIDEETGKPKEGVSKPWIHDIVSEPGYLIFGWPITRKITKAAGPVTFSVRFYTLDDTEKLVYSFSTLDQTVVVKPALDYDIEDIASDINFIDDAEATIKGRAENSPNTSSDVVAENPEWEDGILEALYSDDYVYNIDADRPLGTWRFAHLGIDEDGFSSQPITFTIAALSGDSGVVSYKWSKVDGITDELDENRHDGTTPYYLVVDYVEDETRQADRLTNKTYYTKEGDRYKAISPSTSLDEVREEKTVYSLVSTAIADEVGRYIGTARNRVGKVFSDDLSTDALVFLKPAVPEIGSLEATNGAILDGGDTPVTLSLSDLTLDDELGMNPEAKGCKDTYVWYHRALGTQPDTAEVQTSQVVEGMTESNLILSDPAEEEGWYKVKVINNLNNETADITSEEVRVTKPANKVVLTTDLARTINVDAARENGLHVYVSGLEDDSVRVEGEDTVTYRWYEYVKAGSNTSEADEQAANEGMYADATGGVQGDTDMTTINTDDPEVIRSATTNTFIPPAREDGFYFCVVTNTYNGTSKSVASPFYKVTL